MSFTLETELEIPMALGFSADFNSEPELDGEALQITDAALFNEQNTFTVMPISFTDSSQQESAAISGRGDIRANFSLQSEQQPLELSSVGKSDPVLIPPVSALPNLVDDVTFAAFDSDPGPRVYQTASLPKTVDGTVASVVYPLLDVVFPSKRAVVEKVPNTLNDTLSEGAATTGESSDGETAESRSRKPGKESPKLKSRLVSIVLLKRRLR
jgi:hypothetical protein